MNFRACLYSIGLVFFSVLPARAQSPAIHFFGLDQVELLDSPLKQAMEVNKRYILEMDVDRLLAPYMKEAEISWQAENYGNWESGGLDGHIGGHYLSALALMLASTGDQEIEKRLDYMLTQLHKAQQANGSGYLGGVPDGEKMWEELRQGDIRAANFSLNDRWVPLYNIHKIFVGLKDAYSMAGKEQAKEMLLDLSQWFYELTADFTEDQFQQLLISEHGGLNEVFADVYALTGDPNYLSLAKRMSHRLLLDPLMRSEDRLTGMHANTQIPKVIGFERIAQLASDTHMGDASLYFWETVVNKRSVSIGGNSVREHFHSIDDFSSMISSEEGPETCNSYNMMRLSEKLFQRKPDRKFIDYYERTLFNHILSSQHPERGGFVYFTSMRPNHYRVYSQPHENFWCCVGSGLENHAKYGQAIYAHSDDNLYVNLFVASELNWSEKGLGLRQLTQFPYSESTQLSFTNQEKVFANLRVRYPSWVAPGKFQIWVNGQEQSLRLDSGGYVVLSGAWSIEDVIDIKFPMEVRKEQLPDGSDWVSFLYGPIVLASKTSNEGLLGLVADDSRMGHVAAGPMTPLEWTPVLNALKNPLPEKRLKELVFTLEAENLLDSDQSIELIPFFSIHDSRYQIYWPELAPADLPEFQSNLQSADEYTRKLEAQTVDKIAVGEQQPESEHAFAGSDTQSGQDDGKFWRKTSNFFKYRLNDSNQEAKLLRIMYLKPLEGESFQLLLNSTPVNQVESVWEFGPLKVHDYLLPDQLPPSFEVEFQAVAGKDTPRIHHIRLMK